jgi:predicted enzyme related to lactoylglutathione lyase
LYCERYQDADNKQEDDMGHNPVGWFEIYVKDMKRAKGFYEAVLEIEMSELPQSGESLPGMYAFPMQAEAKGAAGALAEIEGAPTGAGGTIVYFMSQDCAVEAGRAEANGGRLVKKKTSIGDYGFIALVSDPEGNIIGIHSKQ